MLSVNLHRYVTFTLLVLVPLACMSSSFAQTPVPEYTVGVTYFYPTDKQPIPQIDEALDTALKKVQQFYADEMERHGFGRKTFRLETDENGKLRVHHYRGRFATEHYHDSPTTWPTAKVQDEIDETFDWGPGTFEFVWVDMDSPFFTYNPNELGVTGIAGGNPIEGSAYIFTWNFANTKDYYADKTWKIAAHELGHAFGLPHDFRNDHYIMSYGPATLEKELSECAAKALNVHRCFNPIQTDKLHIKMHMLKPIAAPPPNMMTLRFRIAHSEKLYQALLFGHPIDQILPELTLIDCKSLNGNTTIVEFDVNKLSTREDRFALDFVDVERSDSFFVDLALQVNDVHGNLTLEKFSVDINNLQLSDTPSDDHTPVSIPDPNFASVLREELALSPNGVIVQSDMMLLTEIHASRSGITDITGLEHASNLTQLYLADNSITDLTPIAELKQLEVLSLVRCNVSDVSPLANLANLKILYLMENLIKEREPLLTLLRRNRNVRIYLENIDEPLPVTLSHFRAEHTEVGVVLKWTTESEIDNAGFYIYRSETEVGEFKVVNTTMVQGAGTTSERNEYTWTDTTAKPNTVYYYQIEDISYTGERERLATVRMKGFVSASRRLLTKWGDLK